MFYIPLNTKYIILEMFFPVTTQHAAEKQNQHSKSRHAPINQKIP